MMCSRLCFIIMFNYDALQTSLHVKKARNMCNNDGRETKETEGVVRVCSCVFKGEKKKKKSVT